MSSGPLSLHSVVLDVISVSRWTALETATSAARPETNMPKPSPCECHARSATGFSRNKEGPVGVLQHCVLGACVSNAKSETPLSQTLGGRSRKHTFNIMSRTTDQMHGSSSQCPLAHHRKGKLSQWSSATILILILSLLSLFQDKQHSSIACVIQ